MIDTPKEPGKFLSGSNQLGVRQYNERLILRLIRRAGSMPKAEIARITTLSAQTVTMIVNHLLQEKLLCKQPRRREAGKVGQPAVPIALNPDGAFSIGIKIGRRGLEVLLIDLVGRVRKRRAHRYDYPIPEKVFSMIHEDIDWLTQESRILHRRRLWGIGVVAPFFLSNWPREIHAPEKVLSSWNSINIRERVAADQSVPVWFANDATAACVADLGLGVGTQFDHSLHIFVGTFVGGGVVLNGTLYTGAHDNAGAIGSLPIPSHYSQDPTDAGTKPVQLIHCASRYLLEENLAIAGFDPDAIVPKSRTEAPEPIPDKASKIVEGWIGKAADSLAIAIQATAAVIDIQGVIIDGSLPVSVVERLTLLTDAALSAGELRGLHRPALMAGRVGNEARALGGAMLPFYWSFAPDRAVLMKTGEPGRA